jgi:hypothetical protein
MLSDKKDEIEGDTEELAEEETDGDELGLCDVEVDADVVTESSGECEEEEVTDKVLVNDVECVGVVLFTGVSVNIGETEELADPDALSVADTEPDVEPVFEDDPVTDIYALPLPEADGVAVSRLDIDADDELDAE